MVKIHHVLPDFLNDGQCKAQARLKAYLNRFTGL